MEDTPVFYQHFENLIEFYPEGTDEDLIFNEFLDRVEEYEITDPKHAMELLNELDPTLEEAIQKAIKQGYSVDELDSCLLATILFRSYAINEFESHFDDWLNYIIYNPDEQF